MPSFPLSGPRRSVHVDVARPHDGRRPRRDGVRARRRHHLRPPLHPPLQPTHERHLHGQGRDSTVLSCRDTDMLNLVSQPNYDIEDIDMLPAVIPSQLLKEMHQNLDDLMV